MKKKILLVDDEKDILTIMEAILSNAGYEVVKASNGKEAIAMAKDGHPDLIILDIRMPEMDGVKTTDILRNYRPTSDIPIVYLSHLVNAREVEDGHVLGSKIGDLHFLPKSCPPDELLRIVKNNIGP